MFTADSPLEESIYNFDNEGEMDIDNKLNDFLKLQVF